MIRNYAEDRALRLLKQTGDRHMYEDYKSQYMGYGYMYFLCGAAFVVSVAVAVALDNPLTSSIFSLAACVIAVFLGLVRRGEMRYISDALNGEIAPSSDAVTSP